MPLNALLRPTAKRYATLIKYEMVKPHIKLRTGHAYARRASKLGENFLLHANL